MIKRLNQRGEILIIVFVALGVVLFTVLFIIAGAQIYFQNASYSLDSEKAVALAEAGVDKAITSLNKTGGSYSGESETTLGDGSYAVVSTSTDVATRVIEATGYIPNKSKPKVKRTIKITASKGVGISFVYGIQVGEGGLELGNGNIIQGSIYSNGNIVMGNNNTINGDAWVASGTTLTADQQTDCEGSNCQDFLFGKNINGENRLDVAQSFKPEATKKINRISIKVKKIGNPADVAVRIMRDSNGKPDKNGVLASGTLFSSLVTSQYGFIEVALGSNPQLSSDTSYWIMIDTSEDSTNYWSWQNDLAQSYTKGVPKWSPNWNTSNPTWTNLTGGGDLSFKVFMGGTPTSIRSGNNTIVQHDVHANTIDRLIIQGDAYYQTITNSTVAGTSHPGSEDPPPKIFPISEANITAWKNEAAATGSLNTPVCGSPVAWGPGKYTGNLTLGNKCTVIVKNPIWITGNISMGNENIFTLDSSYGTGSGLIIIDGTSTQGNKNQLKGTGVGSSLLMLLTTYDSRENNNSAITIGNMANTGVFYADKGIIDPGNNNQFKELTAWKIKLTNESVLNYETGLSSTLFSSGPTGSYILVKGTYQVR